MKTELSKSTNPIDQGRKRGKPLRQRIVDNIMILGDCWIWTGCTDKDGYAVMRYNRKNCVVGRLSFELYNGAIPEGFVISHSCSNFNCVNPKHLFPRSPKIRKPIFERFIEKVFPEPNTGCWLWAGAINGCGYGVIGIGNRKHKRTHRYAYEKYKGKIPKMMCVMHVCDTPSCVNPDHLFLGTHHQNMIDMASKGRARVSCGDKNPNCKLSEQQVIEIRNSDASLGSLAKVYNVTKTAIYSIKKNKTWTHLQVN